ncbi:TIGR01459 family HAD-type hydrolase [Pseudovibrio sp. Tun.PSC04-5.I4]|uniref:TIGR01459 family HAD-type hydrolase n=1 Tax=Pseudovibrio sp. Tun.PSC04-5.I4 TaxID=1798213 RepID=UPI00088BAB47|nr:TIGR01459 family HAD-type hydrolase [Pseudovibrio sp. Tun.PSC04-5.I4]SDQ79014.1 HAD-superfamily class IIA hydrolase, TIGR01459 [Pseudovibrio sp. Tun.PSC04-5.I4]
MQQNLPISGLHQIADQFCGILCDVWGVLHNGESVFPAAIAALEAYKAQQGGPVVLITNAPRPASEIQAHLDQLGVPRGCYDGIVSSGGVVQADLRALEHAKVYHIGPAKNHSLFHGVNFEFAEPQNADIIVCSGLNDRRVEEPEDYRPHFQDLLKLNLPLICANPDIVAEQGDKLVWCGGALAKLYEEMGGEVIITGKPFHPIYEMALAELNACAGKLLDKKDILAIGDGMPTDIKGANAQGISALFLTDGIHAADLSDDAQAVVETLDAKGLSVHSFMGRLGW